MSGQSSNDDILFFIMRHGEAEPLQLDDKSRQLTGVGRRQVADATQWLTAHWCPEGKVDLALVSPYRRARQTYDVMSLDIRPGKMEVFEDITPAGNPQLVHDYLDARVATAQARKQSLNSILLVSHMPLVSYLVDTVCQSYTTSLFATASIAVIRYQPTSQRGHLETHFQGN
ncbi:phosphohistidine phosphatase SixA [Alteromonas sp. ASW11-19]|uniref:Phosphohistidine phosphatase SixA n=1 Tax=Alteromonas salexigens TaxID=2982530 RepID=A0ABT2VRY5_9ALTE|nr:phosphohistidine phosphatase SixA [Alteromonas salexigens]MCU7555178.1 phosphohistidine phosphatase SixA [Alteromonas salexigens]